MKAWITEDALGRARARAVLIGVAAVVLAAPAFAAGERPPPTSEAERPLAPEAESCPATNPPNRLELVAGTPQTTAIGTSFPVAPQVMLDNTNGCPVTGAAGAPVTFRAPASGASAAFSGSGTRAITVGSDASGLAIAPVLEANGVAGTYEVTAGSIYGSVTFQLTNTAAGVPARIVAVSPLRSSARVSSRYARPLRVKVLDRERDPVAGATVTFAVGTAATRRCGERTGAGAAFAVDGSDSGLATATTGARGIATSPPLTANRSVGTFGATVTASGPSGGSVMPPESGESAAPVEEAEAQSAAAPNGPSAVHFSLSNLAGAPVTVEAGVGSTQSAPAGRRFLIPLVATVLDADGNRVPGTRVTFAAPRSEPGGRFVVSPRGRHAGSRASRRIVEVRTDVCGVAVAPAFVAGRPGGYGVRARAARARPAVFALVNRRR